MKKFTTFLLVSVMTLSLVGCGGNKENENNTETTTTASTTEENQLTEEQQLVVDAVNTKLQTEEFANWQSLYKDFTGNDPKKPEVIKVTHYVIDDFAGVKVDGYLVNISADVAYWVNQEAEQGAANTCFQVFIDSTTKTCYDSITTDAASGTNDTSTEEGRATYLLWIYAGIADGSYNECILNDTEILTDLTETDLEAINNSLSVK